MAIIKCKSCGKQVSDRSEQCPFCKTVLIEHKTEEVISKEKIKGVLKETIIGCLVAAIISIFMYVVLGNVFSNIAATYMGENAGDAINFVTMSRFSSIILIAVIETIFLSILPVLFKAKPDIGYAVAAIVSILLCIFFYFIQESADIEFPIGREDLANTCIFYLKFNAISLPLLQGSLSLSCYHKKIGKSLVLQMMMSVVYFVVTVGLVFLSVSVLAMGIAGIGLSQIVAGIVALVFALFLSGIKKTKF